MKKFLRSIWFLILLFLIIELIFFGIGFFFMRYEILCEPCPPDDPYCPPCPNFIHEGFKMLQIGIIPSAIISIIIYFLIRKFYK